MRSTLLVVLALLAGCIGNSADPTPPTTDPAAPTPMLEGEGAPTPAPTPVGERMPTATERFVFLPDHSLGVMAAGAAEMPSALVPETVAPTAFYQSFAQPLVLPPWMSSPFEVGFEATADIDVLVSFSASSPAVSAQPKAAGFPPVAGWIGTPERFTFFTLAQDAPDSLEAGKVYSVHLKATLPKGGFFVRQGESLAIHTALAYQTADRTPVNYVVGGPDPAGFVLTHQHFNVTAPRATIVLDETGELGPNPAPTGSMHPEPIDVALSLPPDAVFAVLEVTGAPKAGARIDIDAGFRTKAGETIAEGSSPAASEVAVLGPGNLQAYGRDLLVHVTCATCPSGATWALKVTAYGP